MSTARNVWTLLPVLLIPAAACGGDEAPGTTAVVAAAASGAPAKLDLLFMVDNSSSMLTAQQKLIQEMQSFAAALENLPGGLPDLHVAVISSDMGAPGDLTVSLGCTPVGDQGQFQFQPRGDCASAGLTPGATFISSSGGVANYTGSLADVLSCIAPLGSAGCGFEHQLASVTRALGADGQPPPATNAGFLRPDAELAIILLSNEDDCSAPADTELFSLNGGMQSLTNPLGPVANYRCNQFGHLCKDPTSADPNALITPPLNVPLDATGDPPALTLTECTSDDGCSGWLTPVPTFVSQIKALKTDPSQIVVGAIVAPPDPYTITWVPPAAPPPGTSGQLWPQLMHSCGAPGGDDVNPAGQQSTDGTFGDPGVRIAQWARAFGANGFVSSICDPTYAAPMQQFADLIGGHLQPMGTAAPTATPDSTGPLANSPACGGSHHVSHPALVTSGCNTSGGSPGALALVLTALGLGLAIRRRQAPRKP